MVDATTMLEPTATAAAPQTAPPGLAARGGGAVCSPPARATLLPATYQWGPKNLPTGRCIPHTRQRLQRRPPTSRSRSPISTPSQTASAGGLGGGSLGLLPATGLGRQWTGPIATGAGRAGNGGRASVAQWHNPRRGGSTAVNRVAIVQCRRCDRVRLERYWKNCHDTGYKSHKQSSNHPPGWGSVLVTPHSRKKWGVTKTKPHSSLPM